MCLPLGPRRSSWGSSSDHVSVQKITKSEVERIIFNGEYECQYKMDGDKRFETYPGCLNNLYMILHHGKTRVKIAGSRTQGYRDGYETVVMKAPCVNATFLIHREM